MEPSFSENTFFTLELYSRKDSLAIDQNMLLAVTAAHPDLQTTVKLGFSYLTDTHVKAERLADHLKADCLAGSGPNITQADQRWQISGCTKRVELNTEKINRWIMQMWETGYPYDCLLEGWQIIPDGS